MKFISYRQTINIYVCMNECACFIYTDSGDGTLKFQQYLMQQVDNLMSIFQREIIRAKERSSVRAYVLRATITSIIYSTNFLTIIPSNALLSVKF